MPSTSDMNVLLLPRALFHQKMIQTTDNNSLACAGDHIFFWFTLAPTGFLAGSARVFRYQHVGIGNVEGPYSTANWVG